MATRAQREQIAENTDKVRELAAAGETKTMARLVQETEDLIRSTRPIRDHEGYLRLLGDAAQPRSAELATADYRSVKGMGSLIATGAKQVRDTVEAGVRMGDSARQVAETLLEARLKMLNKAGLPDLIGSSKYTKNIAHEMFAKAREHLAEDDVERQHQHDVIAKAVRNRMPDVLVRFLRSLDEHPEKARELFPKAIMQFPSKTPTEAVYALYEREGFALPRRTRAEMMREHTAKQRELAARAVASASKDTFELDDLLRVQRVVSTAVGQAKTKAQKAKLKTHIQQTIEALEAEAAKL